MKCKPSGPVRIIRNTFNKSKIIVSRVASNGERVVTDIDCTEST